jgi:undecaprenyl-diphosphatase
MNPFDASLLHFFNGFADRWWRLDSFMVWLTSDGFQKGGPIAVLYWWAWFKTNQDTEAVREKLLCTALAGPVALVLSRIVSYLVPFRIRPIQNPDFHIRLAHTMSANTLFGWSAFPSDHAAFFFPFVTGLFLVSRSLGWLSLAHIVLFVSLPRVFLGIHHPTDIIAGAGLGVGVAWLACRPAVMARVAKPALRWAALNPALFYAGLFLYTCQVADAFAWVQDVLILLRNLVRGA